MRRAVAVLALLLVAACGGEKQDPAETGPSTSPSPTSAPTSFDVMGHHLWGECVQGKAPYVVYLHGLGGNSHDLATLAGRVAKARPKQGLCLYDRLNVGSSESASGPRPVQASADELEGFLEAAGVEGPVLLVGASYGGLVASRFAGDHPDRVAGIVFADAVLPFETALFTPKVRQTIEDFAGDNQENVDLLAAYDDAGSKLPDVPVTYVDAEQQDLATQWGAKGYRAALEKWVASLPQGRLVESDSNHVGVLTTPELADAVVVLLGKTG